VRLRSAFTIDLQVTDIGLRSIRLQANGRTYVVQPDGDAADPELAPQFAKCLSAAALALLNGEEPLGLRITPKPLIAAPPWSRGDHLEAASLDIFAAISAFPRVVVLGPPGSGKSTIAKCIAICHAGQIAQPKRAETPSALGIWPTEPLTPILVDLGDFVRSPHFPDLGGTANPVTANHLLRYIEASYLSGDQEVADVVEEDIQRGRAVLILDGLDEVPVPPNIPHGLERRGEQLQDLMASLQIMYPRTRVIVTSRPASYSQWSIPGFEIVRLLPLTDSEAKAVAAKAFTALGSKYASPDAEAERLLDELAAVPRRLREVPLFVYLFAVLFSAHAGKLPSSRGLLIEKSVLLLLGAWSHQRLGGRSLFEELGCDETALLERLAAIAYRAHSTLTSDPDEPADLPSGLILEELFELGQEVSLQKALDYVSTQAGILVSPAPRQFRFAHRVFQEFLAALHLFGSPDGAATMALNLCDNDVNWRESALLFADICRDRGRTETIVFLLDEALTLGLAQPHPSRLRILAVLARVVSDQRLNAEKGRLPQLVIGKLREALASELTLSGGVSPPANVEIADALSGIGDPRHGVGLNRGNPEFAWVSIPEGHFLMGSDPADLVTCLGDVNQWDFAREFPKHLLVLKSFHISRFPVTETQFSAFVDDAGGYEGDEWWTEEGLQWRNAFGNPPPRLRESGSLPRVNVSWFEAWAFCAWASDRLGAEIHLPSEAQWEKAARGTDGRIFAWGNVFSEQAANTASLGLSRVIPVGTLPLKDGFWGGDGPRDMIGNIWEWCSSAVEDDQGRVFGYPYVADDGREDPRASGGLTRAARGGHYGSLPYLARVAYRGRDLPSSRLPRQGFRVVLG
jgi:formylglycine-generating enzyme required for sulfatase activity